MHATNTGVAINAHQLPLTGQSKTDATAIAATPPAPRCASHYACAYEGTAVRLVIKTNEIGSLAESLKRYREDGFAFQQRYREIVNINPSAASLMLSEDFDLSLWDKFMASLRS